MNDNQFCCSESILITNNGQCFDLIRGFATDDVQKIREKSRMLIENVEIEEPVGNMEVESANDNT